MSMLSKPVHVSLGAYGRVPHLTAITDTLAHTPSDPLLGRLDTTRMQICPQNTGPVDIELCQQLREQYPDIEWRLHSNVRTRSQHGFIDLADWPEHRDYFSELAELSRALSAPAYSAHAGKRSHASVEQVIDYSRKTTDLFGIPVAIEGHYPMPDDRWLLSSWQEYRQLLESDAYYALDLSHLHILASRSRTIETNLVMEMLACERCIEVHVSHNDGQRDQHLPLVHLPWWLPVLRHTDTQADIFSEGRITSPIL